MRRCKHCYARPQTKRQMDRHLHQVRSHVTHGVPCAHAGAWGATGLPHGLRQRQDTTNVCAGYISGMSLTPTSSRMGINLSANR